MAADGCDLVTALSSSQDRTLQQVAVGHLSIWPGLFPFFSYKLPAGNAADRIWIWRAVCAEPCSERCRLPSPCAEIRQLGNTGLAFLGTQRGSAIFPAAELLSCLR